jgi:hypothetical protein
MEDAWAPVIMLSTKNLAVEDLIGIRRQGAAAGVPLNDSVCSHILAFTIACNGDADHGRGEMKAATVLA